MTPRILLPLVLAAVFSSAALAGPGIHYWQQRGAERVRAAQKAQVETPTASESCCTVKVTRRAVGPQKTSISVKRVDCPGCPEMAAGDRCTRM